MKLTTSQRKHIADKLMDTANYAMAGLVFGQLVTNSVQPLLLLLGLSLYFWGWSLSIQMANDGKEVGDRAKS